MVMTLQEVKKAVDQLLPEELRELRAYLDQQATKHTQLQDGTMNVDTLLQAARAIRDELGEVNFDEMLDAMNEDYIEPVDDDGWSL